MRFILKGPVVGRDAWLHVPRQAIDVEQAEKQLTIPNPAYWDLFNSGKPIPDNIPQHIHLYRWDDQFKYMAVPRNYRVPYTPEGLEILERVGGPVRIGKPLYKAALRVKHGIQLRDDIQRDASNALQQARMDKILCLACGYGKTVCALHAAAERSLFPCLVVVHTNALMDQWREQIQKFYPGVRVGHIQQNTEEWMGYPIAVGMLHTLVQRKYHESFYRYWRLTIFDEAHRLGAQSFLTACSLFPAERWALTATLQREDKMDRAIQLHCGKVAYSYLTQPLKPKCYFIRSHIRAPERRLRSGRPDMARIINDLSYNEKRNEQISMWINRSAAKGRTVLVLGERIQQLESLLTMCESKSKALHVGAMDAESRKEALTKKVVFATQHLAKEGLDRPQFDTLFILIPFKGEGRLRQSAGRILRIDDSKKPPLIFIWEDDVGIMSHLCNKMRANLHQLEFEQFNVDASKVAA